MNRPKANILLKHHHGLKADDVSHITDRYLIAFHHMVHAFT